MQKIQGVEKTNKYIVAVIIDKAGNLLATDDEGKLSHIASIPEHDERLDTMSMKKKFVIDRSEYDIRGGGMPYKFTYVVDDTLAADETKRPVKYCKIVPSSDLLSIMRRHETYANEPLFFTGGSKFLKAIMPYIDVVMLTVIEKDLSEELTVIDKFPIAEYSKLFRKKETHISELAETVKKTASGLRPSTREVEVLNAHFKLIKKIERPKNLAKHYYKFVTFTK